MEQRTRQFEFSFFGLQVFCTGILYADGSLQDVSIDYVMEGMIDWLQYVTSSKSSIIRLIRQKLLAAIKREAAKQATTALSQAPDIYDFYF